MKLKKRNKRSRIRGTRTCGWAMKKHKGSGNRGGKGMAGTGKRAGTKISFVNRYFPDGYFGKQGFTSRSTRRRINNVLNVGEIQIRYKSGELNLPGFKILGKGEVSNKYIIKADSASEQAREKIEKAGGKLILKEYREKKEKSKEKLENKKKE